MSDRRRTSRYLKGKQTDKEFSRYFWQKMVQQGAGLKLEAEAKAYIDAEGISDKIIIGAINQLVKDLKDINSLSPNFVNWSDLSQSNRKAIYPFPGTGALNTRNLMKLRE